MFTEFDKTEKVFAVIGAVSAVGLAAIFVKNRFGKKQEETPVTDQPIDERVKAAEAMVAEMLEKAETEGLESLASYDFEELKF